MEKIWLKSYPAGVPAETIVAPTGEGGGQFDSEALWALLALLFSEAFIEYSSAALENALAHALVAAMVVAWRRFPLTDRHVWITALCGGLLVITRHDFAVLVAPAMLSLFLRASGRARWAVLLAGAGPLIAWSAFSLIYYGSPWPNSAYAKLNNGLSMAESFAAAAPYFRDLVKYDAVTALVIVVAALRGLLHGSWQMRPLALGLALYMLYLGSAGGDYMGGRLFSAPFVLAVAMLDEVRLFSGVFDATFFMYFEDVDLGWRCRLAGWRALYVPAARVYHRFQASSSRQKGSFVKIHSSCNRLRTLLKNASLRHLVRVFPHLAVETALLLRDEGPQLLPQVLHAVADGLKQRRTVGNLTRTPRASVEHQFLEAAERRWLKKLTL